MKGLRTAFLSFSVSNYGHTANGIRSVPGLTYALELFRAPDKSIKSTLVNTTCLNSSPNPIFDHLLYSSQRDDSNKWSNIGFGEEIGITEIKKKSLLI